MSEPKIAEAERAVQFDCAYCGGLNYESYVLESDWLDDAACYSDIITCSHCGKDNKVVERL